MPNVHGDLACCVNMNMENAKGLAVIPLGICVGIVVLIWAGIEDPDFGNQVLAGVGGTAAAVTGDVFTIMATYGLMNDIVPTDGPTAAKKALLSLSILAGIATFIATLATGLSMHERAPGGVGPLTHSTNYLREHQGIACYLAALLYSSAVFTGEVGIATMAKLLSKVVERCNTPPSLTIQAPTEETALVTTPGMRNA